MKAGSLRRGRCRDDLDNCHETVAGKRDGFGHEMPSQDCCANLDSSEFHPGVPKFTAFVAAVSAIDCAVPSIVHVLHALAASGAAHGDSEQSKTSSRHLLRLSPQRSHRQSVRGRPDCRPELVTFGSARFKAGAAFADTFTRSSYCAQRATES